jgi:D-lactate dehydrogenase
MREQAVASAQAKLERIAPASAVADDRVPESLAGGTPEPLKKELVELLGADRVLGRVSDLVRYASDASPYRLLPKAVVMAHDTQDVAKVIDFGRRSGIPVVFRAGGTSLSGQAQSDGILVDVRRHWAGVTVEDDGRLARVRPGTILGHANRVLASYGRKLGPDPASTDIATAGGVIANNSGGMRCGVVHDSYRTVLALTFLLPSGTVIDTGEPGAEERFAKLEPELARGLEEIRDEIRADAELRERIRQKFEIKNTTGYRLCAFLDADLPLEIFRRLIVGSEGTLAFVAEAVFETVPFGRHTTVSFLHFPDIDAATAPVSKLIEAGASAVELMVARALIVASYSIPGTPEAWRELPPESAALLVEFRSDDEADLPGFEERAQRLLAEHDLIAAPEFHRDHETVETYWTVREGLHGLVGKLRPQGTALIMEDVCVPPARVAEAAKDMQALLAEHGFLPGVAGHASAGNLHFMLTPAFDKNEDRDRYDTFMTGLVDLIVGKYEGSLKAEHGTGRNMAPYVEREWGSKATALMWRIKQLADPDGVLGPHVVLSRDPGVHLRDLKSTPPIEEVANTCVECGFCEPVCPSRDITTTPRQRIVLRREMARQPPGSAVRRALLEEYEYDGIETCAADGTCMYACPVGIDTGKLVKELRQREHGPRAEQLALQLAKRWSAVEHAARTTLRTGGAMPSAPTRAAARLARAAVGAELVPDWPPNMPHAAPPRLPETAREGAAAVYFPACVNRIFGRARGQPKGPSLPAALVALSARAGAPVWIPPDVRGHCCSVPWSSKGYAAGARHMANEVVWSLWRWTDEGRLPVVVDASSCTLGLRDEVTSQLTDENAERHAKLVVLDSIEWVHDRLLPDLRVERRLRSAAVHPPCALRHLGLARKLDGLAHALADEVTTPVASTCCGFAGDRGFLHPELTAAATQGTASEVAGRRFDANLCSNRTCEIGLQQATGAVYASFLYPLEELTRDGAAPAA